MFAAGQLMGNWWAENWLNPARFPHISLHALQCADSFLLPQFGEQVLPNCYQIRIGSVAPSLSILGILLLIQFPHSANALETSFTWCFVHIPWFHFPTGFPPDHSPMSSSPGWIVPQLSVWALPHIRTEWTSHQAVFNGRTINTRQGETPLSTYKVTSVWPKAWQGPLSTYCLLWSITAQIISATQMGHIWTIKSCFHYQLCFRFLIKWPVNIDLWGYDIIKQIKVSLVDKVKPVSVVDPYIFHQSYFSLATHK